MGNTDPSALDSTRAAQALVAMRQRLGIDSSPQAQAEAARIGRASARQAGLRLIEEQRVIGGTALARAWRCSWQALDRAVGRGELFSVKLAGRRWFPAGFARLEPEDVKSMCRVMNHSDADPMSKLLFWEGRQQRVGDLTITELLLADRQKALAAGERFARRFRGPGDAIDGHAGI